MDKLYESEIGKQGAKTDTDTTIGTVIPVLQEELLVGKEVRQTGTLRVRKTVREVEEIVRENLISETAQVTRVPKDELVQVAPPVRTEGDEVVIPVVKEFVIVTKQLRLVEEIHITKSQITKPFEEAVTLLSEEVIIERD